MSEDDLPTDLNQALPPAQGGVSADDLPTGFGAGGGAPHGAGYDDEAPTDLGHKRRSSRRFLDIDDEEETNIGRRALGEDVTELDQVPTGLLGILWVKEGLRRGQIYKIRASTVVGRKEGDLIIDDPKVSNPHAKFTIEDGQFTVWDFGSTNGTFVNGERIRAATLLKENDAIKMGDSTFVLKVLE